ncbi:MAG TPA: hypothetical protein VMG98_12035 [Verrucomicrobiae bacterium]|nr:hypothetical protein [Verrucomicrobiae bacterium]
MNRSALVAGIVVGACLWPMHGLAQSQPPVQATPEPGLQEAFDGKWHASITPYVWAPGISGTLVFHHPLLTGVGVASINVATGPSNYLSFVDSGGMVSAEARNNAFDIAGDVIFLNMSNSGSTNVTISGPGGVVQIPITSSVGWHLNTTMWELEPGLVVAHGDGGSAIVFTGARSVSLKATAGWTFTGPIDLIPLTGSDSESETITDGLIGARAKVRLGGRWFAPIYQDFGWGTANTTTSQFFGGFGYAEHWGNILLLYRQLYFDQESGTARVRGLELNGLTLGATINL